MRGSVAVGRGAAVGGRGVGGGATNRLQANEANTKKRRGIGKRVFTG